MVEWVVLMPIFKVCKKDMGHKGEGRLREPWWRQAEAEQNMKATLKRFRRKQGSSGDGNLEGVARARVGRRNMTLEVMGEG